MVLIKYGFCRIKDAPCDVSHFEVGGYAAFCHCYEALKQNPDNRCLNILPLSLPLSALSVCETLEQAEA